MPSQPGPKEVTASITSADTGPTKRIACDRCRGQKLRCLRDERLDATKCMRCSKVDADCSFSATRRVGRPRGSRSKHSAAVDDWTQRSSNGLEQKESDHGFQAPQILPASTSDELYYEDSELDSTLYDLIGTAPPSRSSYSSYSAATPSEPASFIDDFSLNAHEFLNFEDSHEPLDEDIIMVQQMLSDGDKDGSLFVGLEQPRRPLQFGSLLHVNKNIGETSKSSMMDTSISRNTHPRSSADPISDAAQGVQMHRDSGNTNTLSDCLPPPNLSRDSENLKVSLVGAAKKGKHDLIRELSRLEMELYSQLASNEQKDQTASRSPLLRHQFVGNIINTSLVFFNLLNSLSMQMPEQDMAGPFPNDSVPTSPTDSDFGTPSIGGMETRSAVFQEKRLSSAENFRLDVTTVFQLLTCYIRLIRLHSIMFSELYEYLTASQRSGTMPNAIFPGLHVGGLSLDSFGKFQVKLLLQVSVHVLGEIERVLGVPEAHRLSRMNSSTRGILQSAVSEHMIDIVMGEKVADVFGTNQSGIQDVKDKLSSLKNLLRGTINI